MYRGRYEPIGQLVREHHLEAVLVPDTNLLMRHPDPTKWRFDFSCVVVLSDLVLAELDNRKQKTDERRLEQARQAADALRNLASVTHRQSIQELRSLRDGVRISHDLWITSTPIDRSDFPEGLNPKRNDDQIASVAWALRKALGEVPVRFLTGDQGAIVFASSAGIDFFLESDPFLDSSRELLASHVVALANRPAHPSEALEGYLPPRETVVPILIGRDEELASLNAWLLDDDKPKWALVGDGGKGKSAIAFEFASRVQRFDPSRRLQAVIWLSAKTSRFKSGTGNVPDS